MRRVSVLALATAGQEDRQQRQREEKESSVHGLRYGRCRRAVCALLIGAAVAPLTAAASPPRVVAKIATDSAPCGAATGLGSVWLAAYGSGRLIRIDPESNRVVQRIRVARGICLRDTITRIDPVKNKIIDVSPAGNGALAVVVAAGDMWVTSFAGSNVWRFAGSG
jgi:streptogramin lyase